MILQELFKNCDVNSIVLSQELDVSEEDHLTKDELLALYSMQIDKFCHIIPADNENNSILLGQWYDDFLSEEQESRLDIAMYHKKDLIKAKPLFETIKNMPNNAEISDEEIDHYVDRIPYDRPAGYAFEFTEWEKVLGWDVDPKNVKECGEADFLAVILNEMTFNGFLEESQEERRDEFEKMVTETDRLMQLPEEERDKHFVKLEDVYEQLGLEPPTEEERRAERIKSARGIYKNAKKTADMILRYLSAY